MKKKRSAHEKDQPSAKKKGQPKIESELVCEFIESISDKLDDFKDIMGEITSFNKKDFQGEEKIQDISFEQFFEDELVNLSSRDSRFVPELLEEEEVANRTFNYTEKESGCRYRYEFTNSEFLAFIESLDAIEYLIVTTLLAIVISLNFNIDELIVTYQFINAITDNLQIIVEKKLIQREIGNKEEENKKSQQLEEDFSYLNNEIKQLQERIKELEAHSKN